MLFRVLYDHRSGDIGRLCRVIEDMKKAEKGFRKTISYIG